MKPGRSPAASASYRAQNTNDAAVLAPGAGRALPPNLVLASTPSARTFVSNGNSYVKSLSFDSPSRRAGAGGAAASPSPGRGGHGATFSSLRRGGSSSRSGRGGASGRHGNVPRGRGRPSSASGMAPLRPTVYYHMEQGRTGRRVEAAKQQTSGNNDWRWQCCDKEHEEAEIMASMNLYMQQRPMTVPVSPHSMSARARKVTKTPLQIDEQNMIAVSPIKTARPNTAAIVDRETMFPAAPSTAAMEPEGGRVILPQRIVVKAEPRTTASSLLAQVPAHPAEETTPVMPGRSPREEREALLYHRRNSEARPLSTAIDYSGLESLMIIGTVGTAGSRAPENHLEVLPRKPAMRRPLSAPMRRPNQPVNSPR